jgi:hypothetical protein
MKIIHKIFDGSVIRAGAGKIICILQMRLYRLKNLELYLIKIYMEVISPRAVASGGIFPKKSPTPATEVRDGKRP